MNLNLVDLDIRLINLLLLSGVIILNYSGLSKWRDWLNILCPQV